jgi:phosphoribosylanthranilate isomerase
MSGFHVSNELRHRIMAALIDSGTLERPGGTGEVFYWKRTADLMTSIDLRLVVAGGLTSQNVPGAIDTIKPWGVDVASGVEASPGKKDPEKVRAFVRAVREMDRRAG